MSQRGPEGSESRAFQKLPLHGSPNPAAFYSSTPRPPIVPTPHRPSTLRQVSTPGLAAASPTSPSTFSIVLGSPPLKGLASNTIENPSATGKKRGRPFRNLQATPPTQSIPKKKGRPFKTPEAAAAAAAAAASDHTPKKRGRPFKNPLEAEQIKPVVPPEPKFIPFICEWKDCPAELHNLDTLRAHLHTVHLKKQPPGGPYGCLWRKCYQEHKVVDAEMGASKFGQNGVKFKTKEEWRNHVKMAHLDSVAWHQGDGPKVALGECCWQISFPWLFFQLLTNTRVWQEATARNFPLLPLRRRRPTSDTFSQEPTSRRWPGKSQ